MKGKSKARKYKLVEAVTKTNKLCGQKENFYIQKVIYGKLGALKVSADPNKRIFVPVVNVTGSSSLTVYCKD